MLTTVFPYRLASHDREADDSEDGFSVVEAIGIVSRVGSEEGTFLSFSVCYLSLAIIAIVNRLVFCRTL